MTSNTLCPQSSAAARLHHPFELYLAINQIKHRRTEVCSLALPRPERQRTHRRYASQSRWTTVHQALLG